MSYRNTSAGLEKYVKDNGGTYGEGINADNVRKPIILIKVTVKGKDYREKKRYLENAAKVIIAKLPTDQQSLFKSVPEEYKNGFIGLDEYVESKNGTLKVVKDKKVQTITVTLKGTKGKEKTYEGSSHSLDDAAKTIIKALPEPDSRKFTLRVAALDFDGIIREAAMVEESSKPQSKPQSKKKTVFKFEDIMEEAARVEKEELEKSKGSKVTSKRK